MYKSRLNVFRTHAIIRTSLSDGIGSCHAFLLTVEFRLQGLAGAFEQKLTVSKIFS